MLKVKSIVKESNEVLHESELLLQDFVEIVLGDKVVKDLIIEKETIIGKDRQEIKRIKFKGVEENERKN